MNGNGKVEAIIANSSDQKVLNGFGASNVPVVRSNKARGYPQTMGNESKVPLYSQPSQDDMIIAPKNAMVTRLVQVLSASISEIPISGKNLFVQFVTSDQSSQLPAAAATVYLAFDDSPNFITIEPTATALGYNVWMKIRGIAFNKVRVRSVTNTTVQMVAFENDSDISVGVS